MIFKLKLKLKGFLDRHWQNTHGYMNIEMMLNEDILKLSYG